LRVDVIHTRIEEKGGNKKRQSGKMDYQSENKIESLELVIENPLVVFDCNTWVYDQAKGEEIAPLRKEEKQKDADEVVVDELVEE